MTVDRSYRANLASAEAAAAARLNQITVVYATAGVAAGSGEGDPAGTAASAVSAHAALTETHGITAFGASLVNDANAAGARTTLELGTAAQSASTDFATSGHTHSGVYEPADGTILKDADIGTTVAAQGHDHSGTYEPADATILKDADIGVTVAAESHTHGQLHDAASVADSTSIDLTLTGQQISAAAIFGTSAGTVAEGNHTHAGGSDPWTVVVLESDFAISTAADNNVTGLAFAPAASTRYMIEGYFLLQTATTTVGARPGVAWPTGYSDGAAFAQAPNTLTAVAMQHGTAPAGTASAASTGLPVINRSYHSQMQALLLMGASPGGDFQITLRSETGGTTVTMKAGSLIRYRTY